MTSHPDTERLRYEIEAKTEFDDEVEMSFWPNGIGQSIGFPETIDCFNSTGKHIATFRLKAWK
jgi:hypothetical protein